MDGEKEQNVSPVTSNSTTVHHETLDSDNGDVEEISESFVCCVCLDLLYKPIVLACGHISCFWCVHRAMDAWGESHCPVCRCPYNYFPSICLMLHYLLLRMYPLAYKRREKQVLGEVLLSRLLHLALLSLYGRSSSLLPLPFPF
ncbi:E3 ubiquitin-protein ligase PRT1-like isoform X2 [Macadamia integrifolia]|uniref:E3 ubiquitin-protein ligase PRT1-like isoform X2 n=1 Tax=Macadamia integrifolia TaxID=60698 RepID=UPI001C4F23FF|nr:E3 ubiquitin-protein ligase PRT1-like isoform X2 [Macadamia integrifolia]